MTTTRQNVTTEPTAIAGLADDTTYLLVAQGSRRVNVATAGAVPEAGGPAVTVAPGERLHAKKTTATEVYVWAARGGSLVVLDDQLVVR